MHSVTQHWPSSTHPVLSFGSVFAFSDRFLHVLSYHEHTQLTRGCASSTVAPPHLPSASLSSPLPPHSYPLPLIFPSLYFAVRQSARLKERERATNCQRRAEFAFTCLICEERKEEIGIRGLSSVIQLFWILGDLLRSQRSFITPACSQTWGQFFSRFELLHS